MCTADNVRPKWRDFDYEDRYATAPDSKDHNQLVWIVEGGGEVNLGYFDGFTWRLWTGSDDVGVCFWAPLAYPTTLPEYHEPDDWDVDSEFYPEPPGGNDEETQ